MIVVNWWNKKTGANAVMVTETMFSSLGFYLDYFVLLNFLTNFIPSENALFQPSPYKEKRDPAFKIADG